MNKISEFENQQLSIANEDYESSKKGAGHSVTIAMIAKRNKVSAQKLKDWRERNGRTRKGQLNQSNG